MVFQQLNLKSKLIKLLYLDPFLGIPFFEPENYAISLPFDMLNARIELPKWNPCFCILCPLPVGLENDIAICFGSGINDDYSCDRLTRGGKCSSSRSRWWRRCWKRKLKGYSGFWRRRRRRRWWNFTRWDSCRRWGWVECCFRWLRALPGRRCRSGSRWHLWECWRRGCAIAVQRTAWPRTLDEE